MENIELAPEMRGGVNSFVMTKPGQSTEARLSTLEERSTWHKYALWGLGAALLGLISWWIPHEADALQKSIQADTARQLEPIKVDMARVDALLELKETKNVSEAIRKGVNFSEPKYALVAVQAIAQQAQVDAIQTDPSVLVKTNQQVKDSIKGFPGLLDSAWSTRLALANYRSSLPYKAETEENSHPTFTFKGLRIKGGKILGGRQTLGGAYWLNVEFINTVIEYDGSPMILENVKFINCRFVMKYNIRSDRLNDMLLAQNPVTGSFA